MTESQSIASWAAYQTIYWRDRFFFPGHWKAIYPFDKRSLSLYLSLSISLSLSLIPRLDAEIVAVHSLPLLLFST